MHIKTRNINTGFYELVSFFQAAVRDGSFADITDDEVKVSRKASRVGQVVQIDEPVTITYSHPKERVLVNQSRDANPFFHLYEALWMIAGRNDIAPLNYYSSNYAKQVQDGDSLYANGAYGYRWRKASSEVPVPPPHRFYQSTHVCDQLKVLVNHLKKTPNSRRAVLSMWNVSDDLLKVDTSKDICCNLNICFSIRDVNAGRGEYGYEHYPVLDMTVFNRSNDLIWGALGANYVHFTILQEYLAAHLGCGVGVYSQVSNNLHIYTKRFKPEEWLDKSNNDPKFHWQYRYNPAPLVKDPRVFDKELQNFVEFWSGKDGDEPTVKAVWQEPFFRDVAGPMLRAFCCHKLKRDNADIWAGRIQDEHWRTAAQNWLERRRK